MGGAAARLSGVPPSCVWECEGALLYMCGAPHIPSPTRGGATARCAVLSATKDAYSVTVNFTIARST